MEISTIVALLAIVVSSLTSITTAIIGKATKKRFYSAIGLGGFSILLTILAAGWIYFHSESPGECARMYVKMSKESVAAVLRGTRSYLKNDFHWPLEGDLDIPKTLESARTMEGIVRPKLFAFIEEIERGRAIFERQAPSQLFDAAIDLSNDIRKEIVVKLQKAPSNQKELIELKIVLLQKFQDLSDKLDPPAVNNSVPTKTK